MRRCRLTANQRGYSIMEVLIALAMTGVLTLAMFQLYITQHKNYMTQEDISTVQQNARASVDEISRHLRMAGAQLPAGMQAIEAYNTNPDTIVITYYNGGCDTYLSAAMPQPSAELKCATDVSCFTEGQWVYIYEPDSAAGEWFEITQVQEAARHLQHNTMPLSRKYGKDALVLSVTQLKFYVDTTADPQHPRLMVQPIGQSPQVFAENITDLQFLFRMKNGLVVDEPVIAENIREVRISVTGRSKDPDWEKVGADDDDDDDNGNSSAYRYRTYTTSVYLRNLGS